MKHQYKLPPAPAAPPPPTYVYVSKCVAICAYLVCVLAHEGGFCGGYFISKWIYKFLTRYLSTTPF